MLFPFPRAGAITLDSNEIMYGAGLDDALLMTMPESGLMVGRQREDIWMSYAFQDLIFCRISISSALMSDCLS